MTDVGQVVVRIAGDVSDLKSSLKEATNAVHESTGEMTEAFEHVTHVLETFGIYLAAENLIEFGKSALETADQIYILSERTGIAGETLSALNIPLKQNGSSLEEFGSSMKFLSRNIETAAEGNQELITRFDSLGLSVTKLKALTPEEQLLAVAEALGEVNDQGKLTNDVLALMGRGAAGLIPLIKETGGNLQEFIDKAKETGNILTDEEIRKVHEYDDAWVEFVENLKVKAVEAATALDQLAHSQRLLSNEDSFYGDGGHGTPTNEWTGSVGHHVPTLDTSPGHDTPPRDEMENKAKGNNDDLKPPAPDEKLGPYIQSLKDEAAALGVSQLRLAEYRAEKEGAAKAAEDFQSGLRDSKDLSDEEKQQIDAATDAYVKQKEAIEELRKKEQEHIHMVAQLEAQISSSLADLALNYKSLGDTVTGVFQQIAKQLIEMQITTPLVQAIGGTKSSPGLLSGLNIGKLLGFAGGGDPPVGVPSIVGENGPELFVPKQAGTIIPNGAIGGTSVVVQQTINLSPGLAETVNAGIMNAAPHIAAAAQAAVFAELQKGGSGSRIAGLRT